MSLGINVLIGLVRKATEILYPDFDIELIESHHNRKLDAPSGTAIMIADGLNDAAGGDLSYVYDRHTERKSREKKTIGIHSIRGGNIIGEHTVLFAGPEENLTISHSAISRNVFARGAIRAAQFIYKKEPGMYSMQDLVSS
jgi:4-hydroxy-tetrahydrodipicolinate reductase